MRDTIENYVASLMLSLRQPFRANDPAIWIAPAILGLPFFMPLAVMIFEFTGAARGHGVVRPHACARSLC